MTLFTLIDDYQSWRRRRRAVKEARLLLREARRGLVRASHRLQPADVTDIKAAIDALAEAVRKKDYERLPQALNALDRKLDDRPGFARKSTVREYTESIAVAVLIALFLRAFVVEAFKIPSGSMIPTLQVGDHIFVNKFVYGIRIPWTNYKFATGYRKPRRGEVIVFIYPKEPDKDFIKRIVAVEGDTVEIKDNVLYVNGKAVPREHVAGDCIYEDYEEMMGQWEERRCDAFQETLEASHFTTIYNVTTAQVPRSWPLQKVPSRSVFVMGDNRDNSHDSRYWGFVPFDLIKGRAMVIWWSTGEPEGFRLRRMFSLVH
jgi:signal peptidase I